MSYLTGQPPGPVTARLATRVFTAYNTLAVYVAPLLFAWAIYWLGTRQRMRPAWIVTGVALICVLGGFQNLIFYDKGYVGGGVLLFQSGLLYVVWPAPQGHMALLAPSGFRGGYRSRRDESCHRGRCLVVGHGAEEGSIRCRASYRADVAAGECIAHAPR